MRLFRAEVLDPNEINIVHVMNRTVRRCFLMGDDRVSGKNFDHRKVWIEQYLKQFAAQFGIDLLCFSILSNHFHLILRTRPDVVETWDDTEVARRWLMICPHRQRADGTPLPPTQPELNMIRNCPVQLAEIRSRLSLGGCGCCARGLPNEPTGKTKNTADFSKIATSLFG